MDYVKKITTDLIEKILSKGVRDMPQNPAAQGYDEKQIRAFYYLPEKQILITMSMIEEGLVKELEKLQTNGVSVRFGETEGTAYEGNKGKQNADDIATLQSDIAELQSGKADVTYESLETESKEVVGAINELNSNTVKNTDYASTKKAGIVKSGGAVCGITINDINGNISLAQLTDAELEAKTDGKAVTANKIDKAVMEGVVNNKIELTAEQQAKAQAWLGISGGGKLYKHSVIMYGSDSDFTDTNYPGSDETGYFYPNFSFTYYSSSSETFHDLAYSIEFGWINFEENADFYITDEGGMLTESYRAKITRIYKPTENGTGEIDFSLAEYENYYAHFYMFNVSDTVTEV